MKARPIQAVVCGVLVTISAVMLLGTHTLARAGSQAGEGQPANIRIDYPLNGSVFPPDITAPTFLWHDGSARATTWTVDVRFQGGSRAVQFRGVGVPFQLGAIDPEAGPPLELNAEQSGTLTWKPDAESWARIKRLTVKQPATITITGYAGPQAQDLVSSGTVTILTSIDQVGAPLFYRDVPLMLPTPDQKGPISPLPASAIPLIKWRMRSVSETESRVVMQNLPTCANCHSFSRDGKTFGLDMDGPRNDKGLYALLPVSRNMTITTKNMIHWSDFELNQEARASDPAVKRFGFMSQVSPDGRYVVTSIGPPNNANRHQDEEPGFAPGILDRLYSTNYRNLAFTQVFYPTRGILAWYDKTTNTMQPLPGADDPHYVQTSAFWSPDGKYLIFSRALARDPYPKGAPKPTYANDPNETQIQYDLYKIPFNGGRGGEAVPLQGASANGMSNNFPKVSPDGKWIVFVQCKNGLLMRPDSRLYIVPFAGGKARPLNANTPLMNSWHTFSPNGRWLAFSSKGRGPYTQLMLTHIDADGNDTPAILVENTTAANRAVNIPEFVNAGKAGIDKIDPQAIEFYRLFDQAFRLMEANDTLGAIRTMKQAIAYDPTDALAHYVLATALSGNEEEKAALVEYRRAVELEPKSATYSDHLAISLDLNGDLDGAVQQLQRAIELAPNAAEYRFNLGVMLEARDDLTAAIESLRRSAELSRGNWRSYGELAKVYDKAGNGEAAIDAALRAIEAAQQANDEAALAGLHRALDTYRANALKTAAN